MGSGAAVGMVFLPVYDQVNRNRCRLSVELSGEGPDRRGPCLHPDALSQCLPDERVAAPDRRILPRCSRSVRPGDRFDREIGSTGRSVRPALWNRSRTSPARSLPSWKPPRENDPCSMTAETCRLSIPAEPALPVRGEVPRFPENDAVISA